MMMRMLTVLSCVLLAMSASGAGATECRSTTCWDYAPGNSLVSWFEVEWDGDVDYYGPDSTPFVTGDIIWVAASDHLLAYDGSDPRNVRLIHAERLSRAASYVTIADGIAFVTGYNGLTVLDVADPRHPVVRALPAATQLYRAVYRDGYLYAIGYNRVVVYDVHNPAAPFIKATHNRTWNVSNIALHGDDIIAHDQGGSLFCLTLNAAGALSLKWEVQTGGYTFSCAGDLVYVPVGYQLLTYRLAAAGAPSRIASRIFDDPGTVQVVDDKLYVQDNVGIRVFSPASAPEPRELGIIGGYTWYMSPTPLGDLVVMYTGFGIILIADPNIRTDQPDAGLLHLDRTFQGIGVRGDLAFGSYANAWPDPRGIVAFDVSNPRVPRVVGEISGLPRYPYDMVFRDHYLFTNSLVCVDIADPAHMRLVNATGIGNHFAIQDSIAFVCGWPGGGGYAYDISSVDIGDPSRPQVISTLPMGIRTDLIAHMEPDGDYLLVGAEQTLSLVDVSDPRSMKRKWTIPMQNGYCRDLALQGGLVFYIGDESVMAIVDISDRLHPRVRSMFYPPVNRGYQSIAPGNGVVYLTSAGHGTLVIDTSDPDHPWLKGAVRPRFKVEPYGANMGITDDQVILLTFEGNLQVSPRQCGDVQPLKAVSIDVKPGNDCNRVACGAGARGQITVAVLTTKDFDAATIDPTTLRFGPGGAVESHFSSAGRDGRRPGGEGNRSHRHLRDVDCDGDVDFVAHFDAKDAAFACGDTIADLTGSTMDGTAICAEGMITTRGHCRGSVPGDGDADLAAKSGGDEDGCLDADKQGGPATVFNWTPTVSPNPFNPVTEITIDLAAATRLSVSVFDIAGRRAAQLVEGEVSEGRHVLEWRGCDDGGHPLPSGVYIIRIVGGGEETVLRAALIR